MLVRAARVFGLCDVTAPADSSIRKKSPSGVSIRLIIASLAEPAAFVR
jgi:hypothetical protein